MSQQTAIRAEKDRQARERRALIAKVLEALRRYTVPAVGAVVLATGGFAWGAGALSTNNEVGIIESAIVKSNESADSIRAELDAKWRDMVKTTSTIELSRVEADRATFDKMAAALPQGTVTQHVEDPDEEFEEFERLAMRDLSAMADPVVGESTVELSARVGSIYRYVGTVQYHPKALSPVQGESPEAAAERWESSQWMVIFYDTDPTGQISGAQAYWVDAPVQQS